MAAIISAAPSETTSRLAYFERDNERAKMRLSRNLHDELGGFLVGAVMDTAWAQQHFNADPVLSDRLERIRKSLASAIDLKRRLIEDLCPSLLENFGLFAALRWYHAQICSQASLNCVHAYPEEEPPLSAEASTVLFRVVQEALAVMTRQPSAKNAHLHVDVAKGELCIRVRHDGDVLNAGQREEIDLVSLWLIEHRVRALGGTMVVEEPAQGGRTLRADIPLGNLTPDEKAAV